MFVLGNSSINSKLSQGNHRAYLLQGFFCTTFRVLGAQAQKTRKKQLGGLFDNLNFYTHSCHIKEYTSELSFLRSTGKWKDHYRLSWRYFNHRCHELKRFIELWLLLLSYILYMRESHGWSIHSSIWSFIAPLHPGKLWN